MIALFLIGLAGTAMILGAIPLVAFTLMLETCSTRDRRSTRAALVTASGFAAVRGSLRPAA
jgi:hypothetical protein